MTTEQIKTTVTKHRHAVLIGGLAGLLILGSYVAYVLAMTPKMPNLKTAPASEAVAYVSDSRGLGKLSQIEQQQFMQRWRDVLVEDSKKKAELRDCLDKLTEKQREAFTEAMFTHMKRAFLDEAKTFSQTPREEQYAFLKKRILEGRQQLLLMKDIAVAFKNQYTGNQDDLQKWLLDHVTAEERALGEPYFNALKQERPRIEKEAQTSQPASAPTGRS